MYRLNSDQLKQLADFTSNLSLVFFASVIAPLFSDIDTINVFNVTLGLLASVFSLTLSMIILRRL